MRLSGGENQRNARRGFRIAALPLIAIFANLSLPTQAALPQLSATDWRAPLSEGVTARLSAVRNSATADIPKARIDQAGKTGRWWAYRRALPRDAFASASDPDIAMARGFPAKARDRFGLAAVRRADSFKLAYASYDPTKLIWSPLTLSTPPVRKGDHKWMRRPLPADTLSPRQQACLATAIYFEARGETPEGQAAVAQVILNRVRSPAYPDTACGVVYQNAELHNRCQFSFACDGVADTIARRRPYERAERIAMAVTSGQQFVAEVGSSTHYFADYVRPKWAGSMIKMASIGTHQFFRTKGGGWK